VAANRGLTRDDEALVRIRLRSGDGPEREAEREAVAKSLVVISQNAAVARIVFIKADEDKGHTLARIESGIAAMQLAIRAASREVNRGAVEELGTFLGELAASLVDVGDQIAILASLGCGQHVERRTNGSATEGDHE
jgi:hypothetical protein